jgi:hypothetical protein
MLACDNSDNNDDNNNFDYNNNNNNNNKKVIIIIISSRHGPAAHRAGPQRRPRDRLGAGGPHGPARKGPGC